ncbi:hypothetical protein M422DRAFT_37776, partial [Sphaerobolus stellatus SS14]
MPKYQLFGYLINQEWLYSYGVDNDCRPTAEDLKHAHMPEDEVDIHFSTISNAVVRLLGQAGLSRRAIVGLTLYKEEPAMCLVLATNKAEDKLPMPPPESWAKLKEILKTKREPRWYAALE